MPIWELEDPKTGEVFETEAETEPTQEQAQAALKEFLSSDTKGKEAPVKKSDQPSTGKAVLTSMIPHPADAYEAGTKASRGGAAGWLEAANEVLPNIPGLGGLRLPQGVVDATGAALDPLVSRLGGVSAATMELAKPVTGPLMMADRGVRELGKRIYYDAAGTEVTPEKEAALRNYTLTGQESPEISDYKTPGLGNTVGESVLAQSLAGVGTDVANYPVTNLALAKGFAKVGGALKGGEPAVAAEFAKTPKELKLLRGVTKPQAGTKFAKNFNDAGSNGLRLISEEAPSKGGDSFQRLTSGADKALEKLGETRSSMMQEAAGKTVSGKSIKQSVSRLGDDPYYKNLDPEGSTYFQERAATITDGPIPVEEAQAIYSTVEKMIRRARKASGDAEAALENNDKFQYLESIRENLGKQLNETVSRTPNEYLENSRNFSDVYRVLDRAEHAEGLYRNDPSNTFVWRDLGNFEGWKAFLKRVGLKRTSETDLAASLKIAKRGGLPEPTPLPPQKPSALPQR